MAQIFPSSIESYSYTKSEKYFYNSLKEQLPDKVRVFYSISWFTKVNGQKKQSECDFLIFNPDFGFLVIEVKGGKRVEVIDGQWRLIESESSYGEEEYRVLKRSPFVQARESMYYFKNYFEEEFQYRFSGIYGFAVAFPLYSVTNDFGCDGPKDLVVDMNDMKSLEKRINEIFYYWSKYSKRLVFFSPDQQKKFIQLVNKRVALSAAAGSLIEIKQKQLFDINRMQDNYIDFLKNYKQVFIMGGAGTGKTWIGMKKAIQLSNDNMKVLFVCFNKPLSEFVKSYIGDFDIDCYTFSSLMNSVLGNNTYLKIKEQNPELHNVFDCINYDKVKKYDAIIVDEAQDFSEDWSITIRLFLKDDKKSYLYVLYDKEQNIFGRDFGNGFQIDFPPFLLRENLRNTRSIFNWVIEKTGFGKDSFPNLVESTTPELHCFNDKNKAIRQLNLLLNKLIIKEFVSNKSIIILSNRRRENSILSDEDTIGEFKIVSKDAANLSQEEVNFKTVHSFKGLESDVVIYINHKSKNENNENYTNYVAFTRAKYYLYIIECCQND